MRGARALFVMQCNPVTRLHGNNQCMRCALSTGTTNTDQSKHFSLILKPCLRRHSPLWWRYRIIKNISCNPWLLAQLLLDGSGKASNNQFKPAAYWKVQKQTIFHFRHVSHTLLNNPLGAKFTRRRNRNQQSAAETNAFVLPGLRTNHIKACLLTCQRQTACSMLGRGKATAMSCFHSFINAAKVTIGWRNEEK